MVIMINQTEVIHKFQFAIIIMKQRKYKYTQMASPEELGFLQYYMLPQKDEFDYVYRPCDDSFLMLSVLNKQLQTFPLHPLLCEVGSGSGILSAHVAKWLKDINNEPTVHIATDINLDACILSQKYYQYYNANVQQVCTSLMKGCTLQPQVIICNPPYIPTELEQAEQEKKYLINKLQSIRQRQEIKRCPHQNLLAYSYMGGPDGLDITRSLIQYISWESRLYLIVMGEEGLKTLEHEVISGKIIKKGFTATFETLQHLKKYNEQLYVIHICFTQI